ncbi:cytochrome C [Methylococcus mesophilus]|uniref:cytochrome C n=1 Tax=Methylococcus mesophilus TaxID=2993564 RepID=UPI00224AA097|nr:cytochrome C [Methylococcus mesophilus]UZR28468.1 cytochrome C [Methylococcus mesophilus]
MNTMRNPLGGASPPNASGAAIACLLLGLTAALAPEAVLAAGKIKIARAGWSDKTGTLIVKGTAKNVDGAVDIYDINGRRLGGGQGPSFSLSLGRSDLPAVPCAVRVQSGDTEAIKPVKGAPKSCAKTPTCSIVAPASGTALKVGVETHFEAAAGSKDPAAQPLKYEWDFAGGAWGHPTDLMAMATFIRDNSTYRVRFSATDAQGRRCEDAVDVVVGTPPAGLPSKVPEQAAPKLGGELDGTPDDLAVLPFEDWTMQHTTDAKTMPNDYVSFNPLISTMNAYVYKKARLPVPLAGDAVEVDYSAASNPSDPVGADSVNSTSRNWPVGASLMEAAVQKTDLWETFTRGDFADVDQSKYINGSWIMDPWKKGGQPQPDEGYFKYKAVTSSGGGKVYGSVPDNDPNNSDHGRYMPGIAQPYQANYSQPFSKFLDGEQRFAATTIPMTDIDDQGRVNPFPLLRVEAKQNGRTLAGTDAVLSNSRDHHCRECHAKGGIAAPENPPQTKAACRSSPFGAISDERRKRMGRAAYPPCEEKPAYYSVSDFGGDPNSIFDQEYAAALNYSSIHEFYDGLYFLDQMLHGVKDHHSGKVIADRPSPCYGCHATAMLFVPFKQDWWDVEGFKANDPVYEPNYSIAMHRFHGELQWNDAKTGIVRDDKGMYVRWDWKTKGRNTRTLFPTLDANGNPLPMEENCLKCHSGHREQLYRDRMYTAGVTCYDCHGDMLAVGEAFPKNYLANKDKVGSLERDDYRVPWFDETDCGSCHVGDGNLGNDGSGGFFSAGVMKRAFDDADLSATTRAVDRTHPDSVRFAVAPKENYKATFPTLFYYTVDPTSMVFQTKMVDTKIDAPVYRHGKDSHGDVACAACHGAAHAVWPNRDPNANDNVTALQLQGHTGTIHECNVCHTTDSFAKKEDLDGGQYSGDAKAGILGGPHNMHPVNDPYWWKSTEGDSPNSDGTIYGGWHNDYAKSSGAKGEDQCAACHGNDHKGTRLSKTPVDRVFDFRGFDGKKLKKAGFKSKVVKVAAGTPIGCDTCHSLETSFIGSPGH